MRRLAFLRKLPLAGVLALVVATAIACGGGDDNGGAKSTPKAASEVNVTVAQDGTDVRLARGGKLIVTLDSNATTGYAWKVADAAAPPLAAQVDQRYDGPQTTAVGAGGKEVYTFTAASAGNATLRLTYQRGFEPSTIPPVRTFTLKITVE